MEIVESSTFESNQESGRTSQAIAARPLAMRGKREKETAARRHTCRPRGKKAEKDGDVKKKRLLCNVCSCMTSQLFQRQRNFFSLEESKVTLPDIQMRRYFYNPFFHAEVVGPPDAGSRSERQKSGLKGSSPVAFAEHRVCMDRAVKRSRCRAIMVLDSTSIPTTVRAWLAMHDDER